jgi:hypothetical protein
MQVNGRAGERSNRGTDHDGAHSFLVRTEDDAVMLEVAKMAQDEAAVFLKSDGADLIDPDGAGLLFEVPAASVPTDTGFIQ